MGLLATLPWWAYVIGGGGAYAMVCLFTWSLMVVAKRSDEESDIEFIDRMKEQSR